MSQSDEQKGEKSSDEDNENNEGKNKKPEEKLVSDKEKQFPEERESNEEECYDQTEIKLEDEIMTENENNDDVETNGSLPCEMDQPANMAENTSLEKGGDDDDTEMVEMNSKYKDDKPNSEIDATARKFKNSFFEVIEELKLRRTLDLENETRITSLLTEKSEIHRQWEEAVSKNNSLRDMYEKREAEVIKQFEEKIRQYETNKAKHNLSEQCSSKEISQLKDEIRALRLTQYSIDKRANELDRELQLQMSARENHVKQLAEVEKSYQEAVKQAHDVLALLDQVERNVGAANRLHRKLTYNNEHQNCRLMSYKQSLDEKQEELASAKVTIETQNAMLSAYENNIRTGDSNEKELKMQSELCRQLQSLLDESRQDNKNLLKSLKEAQALVDRHIDSVKKHSELEGMAQFELDEVKSEFEELKCEMNEMKKSNKQLQDDLEEKQKTWTSESDEKDGKLAEVKDQLEAMTLAQNSLEEANSKLSEQKEQLTKEIDMLKADTEKDTNTFKESKQCLNQQIEDQDQKIQDLYKQLSDAQSQRDIQIASSQEWKKQFDELDLKFKALSGILVEVQKENNNLKETTELLEKNMVKKENEIVSLTSQLNKTKCQAEIHFKSEAQWKEKLQEMEIKIQQQSTTSLEASTQTDNQLSLQKTDTILVDSGITVSDDINDQFKPSDPIHSNAAEEMIQDQKDYNNTLFTASSTETTIVDGNISPMDLNMKNGTKWTPTVKEPIISSSHLSSETSTTNLEKIIDSHAQEADIEEQDDINSKTGIPPIKNVILKSCLSKRQRDPDGPPRKRVRFNMEENQTRLIDARGSSKPNINNAINPCTVGTSCQSTNVNSHSENTLNMASFGRQQTAKVDGVLKNFNSNPKRSPNNVTITDLGQQQGSFTVQESSPSSPRNSAIVTGLNQQPPCEIRIESGPSSPKKRGLGRRQDCKASKMNNIISKVSNNITDSDDITSSNHQQDCSKSKVVEDSVTSEHATNSPNTTDLSHQQAEYSIGDVKDSSNMVRQQRCNDPGILTDTDNSNPPSNPANNVKMINVSQQQDLTQTEVLADSATTSQEVQGQSSTATNTSSLDECQELFSDEDDDSNVVMCHEVGQQITQIQSFLNNQRLRTSKKRKYPS